MAQKPNSEYKPAIYARLSKEDNKTDTSLSIENQIDIMSKFCEDNGFPKPKVFFDDDRTGRNFEREGFQKLYASALAGDIDVIIVKHTDRFGRNSSQSGVYFDKIHEMRIRFISILQCIDTIDPDSPAIEMLPLLFWVDEMQSRTTSKKIRATFQRMALDGKRFARRAPYGYAKDPNDKHKLIVDPYSAEIVKRIYELRLQKYSYGAIVTALNREGVLSPSAYYQQKTGEYTSSPLGNGEWTTDCVRPIFCNVAYRGDTANNISKTTSFKSSKRIIQPMEDWIIVENTHPALVSREDWQTCYDMSKNLGRVRATKGGEILPFTGLLICKSCGVKMKSKGTYNINKTGEKIKCCGYSCRTNTKMGNDKCSYNHVSVKFLNRVICAEIQKIAKEIIDNEDKIREHYINLQLDKHRAQRDDDDKKLAVISKRLLELDHLIQVAFEKSVLSDLPEDVFKELINKYESEKKMLKEQAEQLRDSIEKKSKAQNDVETFISLMKKHVDITELDRQTAVELIDHITVSISKDESGERKKEIVVYYNFLGPQSSIGL